MKFEWDENKNKVNIKKHGFGFAEASSVFYDDNAILFDDPDHSKNEERFLLIGMSIRNLRQITTFKAVENYER